MKELQRISIVLRKCVAKPTIEFKIYPNPDQTRTLESWLRTCCWIYNQALEQRIKAYKRRGENVGLYSQCSLLTRYRSRIKKINDIPVEFTRDALRRVDRGMKAFFRRIKAGQKSGFPRFRSHHRYNTMEKIQSANFIRKRTLYIAGIGHVAARGQFSEPGKQKTLRIVRRASGWYAQVVLEYKEARFSPNIGNGTCGIDVGLESFATLDNGEKVANPRLLLMSASKLKRAQRHLARCQKGSNRHKKAKNRVARIHEKIVRQRKGFAHRISRELVNRFDGIALENLNVARMVHGNLAKSILDAAWGLFIWYVTFKAANAGKQCVLVDPCGTSQECPRCGAVKAKKLSERTHHCSACGLILDRDQAAAMVIRNRAFRPERGDQIRPIASESARSMKREDV